MRVEEFRRAMAGTKYIPAGSELHLAFHAFSQEALKITAKLNGQYICAQLKALIDRTVVIYPNLTNKRFYYILTMADTNCDKFDGSLAALRGFLDCYEGSEECGMVCADGVYEKGTVAGTKFIAEAKALGAAVR